MIRRLLHRMRLTIRRTIRDLFWPKIVISRNTNLRVLVGSGTLVKVQTGVHAVAPLPGSPEEMGSLFRSTAEPCSICYRCVPVDAKGLCLACGSVLPKAVRDEARQCIAEYVKQPTKSTEACVERIISKVRAFQDAAPKN